MSMNFTIHFISIYNASFFHTLFTLLLTIKLHCTYKYVRSLRNPSILSLIFVYSLPDQHTSLYTQIYSFIMKSFNIIIYICLLSSRLSDFTIHTNMFVHYKILQYYPLHLFTLFQTIRLHCTYKYVHSLLNPSILFSIPVYSLPDYQTSLYIQICSFIIKSFNIILYIGLLKWMYILSGCVLR